METTFLKKADIFVIPVGGEFNKAEETLSVVYSPFTDSALLATPEYVTAMERYLAADEGKEDGEIKEVMDALLDFPNRKKCAPRLNTPQEYTRIAILPNNVCNFKCTYCYSAHGRSGKVMDKAILKTALESFVDPGRLSNKKQLTLSYLGGGEPLLSWDLVRFGIEYSAELAVKYGFPPIHYSVVTNGSILNEEMLEVFRKYRVAISVSFEILEEIQNLQRGSYQKVCGNIDRYIEAGLYPQLRSTITTANVGLMKRMVEEVLQRFPKTREIMMECVTDAESFASIGEIREFYKEYTENFFRAYDYARAHQMPLDCSVIRNFNLLIERFCPGEYTLTPDGEISMCSRICSPLDPGYEASMYGRFGKDGSLTVDMDKFRKLADDNVYKREKCRDCFAKWHCGGGCMAQKYVYEEAILNEICHFTCEFTKKMLLRRIAKEYKEANGCELAEAIANI